MFSLEKSKFEGNMTALFNYYVGPWAPRWPAINCVDMDTAASETFPALAEMHCGSEALKG